MYARVKLGIGSRNDALVVPRSAIVLRNAASGVFVVNVTTDPAVVQFSRLVTGLEDDVHVEVVDGVSEGALVVTTGAAGLQHGSAVVVVDAEPKGAL